MSIEINDYASCRNLGCKWKIKFSFNNDCICFRWIAGKLDFIPYETAEWP